jgi:hypothetical protein
MDSIMDTNGLRLQPVKVVGTRHERRIRLSFQTEDCHRRQLNPARPGGTRFGGRLSDRKAAALLTRRERQILPDAVEKRQGYWL